MSKVAQTLKSFKPMFNRVLVQRYAPELKTKGGIVLPDTNKGSSILEATVMATGPGRMNMEGVTVPMNVATGDKVLLPEYGGTKVQLDNEDYFLFRDEDILGKFEN